MNLLIPQEYGGEGQSWKTVLQVVRRLATVDGTLAHLFGYHCMIIAGVWRRTDPGHAAELLRQSAANRWWWGNSNDPLSPTVVGIRADGGIVINGKRPFSSGSHVADYLLISWDQPEAGGMFFAAVPAGLRGITIHEDWDGFGQRQTGSGTVSFEEVFIPDNMVLNNDYAAGKPFKALGAPLSQCVLLNVFVGVAEGAMETAREYTIKKSRPWRTSGVDRHIDDPWVKRRYGEFEIKVAAARALADDASRAVDEAWNAGEGLTADHRGEAAIRVARANVFAGDTALEVTSGIFEVMGARSATVALGYDRFWRNVRVHTLHNPAEYKTRNVRSWFLSGTYPQPDAYQ